MAFPCSKFLCHFWYKRKVSQGQYILPSLQTTSCFVRPWKFGQQFFRADNFVITSWNNGEGLFLLLWKHKNQLVKTCRLFSGKTPSVCERSWCCCFLVGYLFVGPLELLGAHAGYYYHVCSISSRVAEGRPGRHMLATGNCHLEYFSL